MTVTAALPIVNARLFDWLPTQGNLMAQEASTLGFRAGQTPERIIIINDSGERRATVRFSYQRNDKEGDVMYWEYVPESLEDQRQFKPGTHIRVYND